MALAPKEILHSAADIAARVEALAGEIAVPKDFDRMGEDEIAALFGLGA